MLNTKPGTIGGPRPTPPLPASADPAAAAMGFLALMGDAAGSQAARAHLADVLAAREANEAVLAEIRNARDAADERREAANRAEDTARAAQAQADTAASELRQLQSDKAAALNGEERRLATLADSLDARARDLDRREATVRRARAALDVV